jgi:RNA polymerase sigma-70 factor, ECF subfamily
MGLSGKSADLRHCLSGLVARDGRGTGAAVNQASRRGQTESIVIRPILDQPELSLVPDEALMKDISRQRQAALTELYGRYGPRLKAMIDGVVHEQSEADDVLQEIFLQIWKEAPNYSPKAGKPLGWVVTIARRRAIDRLRRRQAYCRARERYGKQLQQRPQRPRREAYETFVLGDLRRFLKKRMRALPPYQREALELAFFKGLSHREIADETGTPLGTVKTRLELGLQKLTQAIRPLRHKI